MMHLVYNLLKTDKATVQTCCTAVKTMLEDVYIKSQRLTNHMIMSSFLNCTENRQNTKSFLIID